MITQRFKKQDRLHKIARYSFFAIAGFLGGITLLLGLFDLVFFVTLSLALPFSFKYAGLTKETGFLVLYTLALGLLFLLGCLPLLLLYVHQKKKWNLSTGSYILLSVGILVFFGVYLFLWAAGAAPNHVIPLL